MNAPHTEPQARLRARQLIEFWHARRWLPSPSMIHVHPLDLAKLEELITQELEIIPR